MFGDERNYLKILCNFDKLKPTSPSNACGIDINVIKDPIAANNSRRCAESAFFPSFFLRANVGGGLTSVHT